VLETEWLDEGPIRVGRRGRQVSRILGFRYEIVAEVVAYEPPRHIVWQTVAGGATVRTDCRVEPEGDGCRIAYVAEGGWTSGPLRLLTPIAIPVFRRQALQDLRRLARVLAAGEEDRL
jgi:hypothetical protein